MHTSLSGSSSHRYRTWHQDDGRESGSGSAIGALSTFLMLAVVCAAPWLLGGVEARVRAWLFLAVIVSLGAAVLRQARSGVPRTALPTALIPLLVALVFALFQLLPLPAGVHRSVSPGTAKLWHGLVTASPGTKTLTAADAESDGAVGGPLSDSQPLASETMLAEQLGMPAAPLSHPISLYPSSSRRDLGLLSLAAATFLLGCFVIGRKAGQLWLLWLLAANGAAIACFGIIQQITWNGLLYWQIPLQQGGTPFASYVNRNNAAGYLNLCLAAAVALVVVAFVKHESLVARFQISSIRQRVLFFIAKLNARTLLALALTGCIVVGVFCSLSRGAWLSLAGAGIVTTLAVAMTQPFRSRLSWFVLVALMSLALLGWVGRSSAVQNRLSSLLNYKQNLENDRLSHWRTGLRTAGDFWMMGSGLGTYRHVYRLYQTTPDDSWYYHAENQYLEALVEMGVVGLLLLLILIGLLGAAAWRLLKQPPESPDFAWGVVGVFALTSQAIHAFFDFGLYLPANMLLFAALMGGVAGRAASLHMATLSRSERPGMAISWFSWAPPVRHVSTASALALCFAALVGYFGVRRDAACEAAAAQVPSLQDLREVPADEIRGALVEMSQIAEARPGDAVTQRTMARLWMALYRLDKLQQLRGEKSDPARDFRLWPLTSPTFIHGQAHSFSNNNRVEDLETLRDDSLSRSHLTTALRYLLRSRRACPLIADVHLHLGELCVLVIDPAEDWVHLERTRRVGPADANTLYYVGLLELQAARAEMACVSWRRCLELSPQHLNAILVYADRYMNLAERVDSLLPDLPDVLIRVAREHFSDREQAATHQAIIEKAEALIGVSNLPDDELCYLQGSVWAAKQQPLKAIQCLTQAVELSPDEANYRYELALLMRERGMIREAREHAAMCTRIEPRDPRYEDLLRQLIRTDLTGGPPGGIENSHE